MVQRSARTRVAAAVLVLVALGFCVLDLVGAPLNGAHNGVRGTFGALYRGTDSVIGPVRGFVRDISQLGSAPARVRQLQQQNGDLRRALSAADQHVAAAGEVAALQRLGNTLSVPVVAARVVALAPGQGFDWTATIAAGRRDGLQVGQTVVAGDALVGRVLRVDTDTAVVLLAADPGSGVGVRVKRTGQLGLITGRGAAGFGMTPLDPAADLRPGDVVVSGPAGTTSFVPGLLVGTVRAISRGADGSLTAQVTPAVSATALDIVGVLQAVAAPPPTAAR